MNSMKRKLDSSDSDSSLDLPECNLANELLNSRNISDDDFPGINKEDECSNSLDQQKSDNGGSSERPGTSDNKKSEDESKDSGNQNSEQSDRKLADRSKYRNPDMPVGYVKKESVLEYKEGIEYEGYHLVWTPWLYELRLHERPDYATLGELIFMSDEEEVENKIEEKNIMTPQKIKKEKGAKENATAVKMVSKHEKKEEQNIIPPQTITEKGAEKNAAAAATAVKMVSKHEKKDEIREKDHMLLEEVESTLKDI